MAPNKFAAVLHRSTHRIGVILVYSFLEWTLIALLLLNGLFSFLISKFAAFFGLKSPCVLCSRLDHVFDSAASCRTLLCEGHVAEISRLRYCAVHRRLAEAGDLCEDCGGDRTTAMVSWMKRSEGGEEDLRCSCCGVSLESGFYSPYLLLKQSPLDLLEQDNEEKQEEKQEEEVRVSSVREDSSLEILLVGGVDRVLAGEGRVVPVELIDSETMKKSLDSSSTVVVCDDGDWPSEYQFVAPRLAVDIEAVVEEKPEEEVVSNSEEIMDGSSTLAAEMVEVIKECSSVPSPPEEHQYVPAQKEEACFTKDFEGMQDIEVGSIAVTEDLADEQALEEDEKAMDVEANCEISIGSEICDHVHIDEPALVSVDVESKSLENQDQINSEDQAIETEPVETIAEEPVEANSRGVRNLFICPDVAEVEEERTPETPTSVESIHAFHKRFLFERRESGTESIDGSVASEVEGGEPLTMEHLKLALKAERKALSALYTELEEERSASAVAANQTMAMITRLQEEKAAMQMEALQYQRMMEEQSEYDQEALQLLNELMMKREKEKQDLEKELEVYRKRVLRYGARERRKNARSKTNSASSSAEESDDVSLEFNDGDDCSYGHSDSNQNTPIDTVLGSETDQETAKHLITLDESLAEFEEERLSILEQLKALEEKLFSLDEEDHINNLEVVEHLPEENGHGLNGHYEPLYDQNGNVNGFPDEPQANGKVHCDCRSGGYKGKRLLPLFDAISLENEDDPCTKEGITDCSPESLSKFAIEQKKLAIAEEVDNVYERLQALEADREFLKHCVSSLKKGDKGMDLLQEILQHLRDLRSVELRVRNAGDALASLSA